MSNQHHHHHREVWHVMSNQHTCDEVGIHSRLRCVAVIHCTKKYWRTSTTTGKYEYARQFFSIATPFYPSCLAPPAVTLRLCPSVSPSPAVYPSPSLFGSLLSPLTLRLRSPNSLFPLLVFVFASQSRSSRCLLYIFAFLTRYFSC